jgi:Cu(I)/Ag(I) efflux system membrane fusion protein
LIDSQMQLAGNPSLMDPTRAPTYAPGPLQLPEADPVLLTGKAGEQFDRAYAAYFNIQSALAADSPPPPVALNTLVDALTTLETLGGVPDEAQRRFATARRAASRMDGSLDSARQAYREVSRALLIAATRARGPETTTKLAHYYCPMVPGGGGDWMQPGGELRNPYWGSEMLRCGERVQELEVQELEVEESGSEGVQEKEGRK